MAVTFLILDLHILGEGERGFSLFVKAGVTLVYF